MRGPDGVADIRVYSTSPAKRSTTLLSSVQRSLQVKDCQFSFGFASIQLQINIRTASLRVF